MMIRGLCLLVVWVAVSGAAAQDVDPQDDAGAPTGTKYEAIEILRRVDAASKAVRSVKYTGSFRGTGWLADRVGTVEGTAVIGGVATDNPPGIRFRQFLFDVRVGASDSGEVRRLTAGNDGDLFYLVDWQTQTVHEGTIPDVMGSDGRTAQAIGMVEFVHPTPFSDEINGDEAVLKDTVVVGDEPCYVVDVTYRGGFSESTWYFSQKDFLPRRVDRVYRRRQVRATTELVVTDLVVDPELKADAPAFDVPEEFEKTDKFAPNQAARRARRVFDY